MPAPPPNPAILANYPRHCDTYIEDPKAPACLRAYLRRARSPAHGNTSSEPFPKLFATYRGKEWLGIAPGDRVRVVMASRMGDVGITKDLAADHGYSARCNVEQLGDFSDVPPAIAPAPAPRAAPAAPVSGVPAALPLVHDIVQGKPAVRDGIAVCRIYGPGRVELPITYRYKPGARHDYEFRGYAIDCCDVVFKTWGELVADWPNHVAAHKEQLRGVG